jgi:hypothetical protein
MAKPMKWRMTLEHVVACNCNWGCPCTFDAPPTYGGCEAGIASRIVEGKYGGDVLLDGLKWAVAVVWPRAIHEKNGKAVVYLDAKAKGDRRQALEAIATGKAGGAWGMFMATCDAGIEVRTAKIDFKFAGKKTEFHVENDINVALEAIKNPVTGEDHEARVLMPKGFLTKSEDMYSSRTFDVHAGPLNFSYPGRHALTFRTVWKGP